MQRGAQITMSYTHLNGLLAIDNGASYKTHKKASHSFLLQPWNSCDVQSWMQGGFLLSLQSVSTLVVVCSCQQCQQCSSIIKVELINNVSGGPVVSSDAGNINLSQENMISGSGSVASRSVEMLETDLVFYLRICFGNVLSSSHQH